MRSSARVVVAAVRWVDADVPGRRHYDDPAPHRGFDGLHEGVGDGPLNRLDHVAGQAHTQRVQGAQADVPHARRDTNSRRRRSDPSRSGCPRACRGRSHQPGTMAGGALTPVVKSRVVLMRVLPPPSCRSPESITATVAHGLLPPSAQDVDTAEAPRFALSPPMMSPPAVPVRSRRRAHSFSRCNAPNRGHQ